MTIYTSASRTHKHNPCPEGAKRTQEALAKLGLNMQSLVPMRVVLEELGISDTVFSFCEVRKGCEAEADQVLRRYMSFLVHLTQGYLGVYHDSTALNKRLAGHMRAVPLAKEYALVDHRHSHEASPASRKGLEVYKWLLSDNPNYLCALHAGIALMDGAELIGKRQEVHDKLLGKLRELMPDGQ
jgi:hypothetical protein